MTPTTLPDDADALLRRACADLEARVRRGTGRAEDVFARHPDLAADPDAAAEVVHTEFVARERLGHAPDPDEYLGRFPALRDRLDAQFRLHRLVQEAAGGPPPGDAGVPRRLGAYDVVGEVGRGGSAVVYEARDRRLNRAVAVKLLAAHAAGPGAVGRLRAEAEAIAKLAHPNIVQVHEVGEDAGRPFLVLEYADAGSLADRLRGDPLPAAEAARLAAVLARAVGHAHRKGVVHRDLKPANVLLADGDGGVPVRGDAVVPKVADFGLARALDAPAATAGPVGTPGYTAPEQADGRPGRVGPPADVYALGAILYECLTGRPPFAADTPLATLRLVVTADPVPPRRLNPSVPRALETVCLKCLEKSPARRYASADKLADDLGRFLAGEPVRARPAGVLARTAAWCRRRPASAALAASTAVTAAALLAVGVWSHARLRASAAEADAARADAERAAAGLRDRLDEARRDRFTIQLAHAADVHAADPGRALRLLTDADRCPPDLRDFPWGVVYARCRHDRLTLPLSGQPAGAVAFSPDGRELAACCGGQEYAFNPISGRSLGRAAAAGGVVVYDAATGREAGRMPGAGPTAFLAFAPDGRLAAGGPDGVVRVWDRSAGAVRDLNAPGWKPVTRVAFAPDGRSLAVCRDGLTLQLIDADTGRELWPAPLADAKAAAFLPDGRSLAVVGPAGEVRRHAAADGAELARRRLEGVDYLMDLAVAPDGSWVAFGGRLGRELTVCRADTLEPLASADGPDLPTWCVAASPDGATLAAAGDGREVVLRDARTQAERGRLLGHTAAVRSLAFAPDGRSLASASYDGTVRVWDWPPPAPPAESAARAPVRVARRAADGRGWAVVRADGTVEASDGRAAAVEAGGRPADIAPGLDRVATGGVSGRIRVVPRAGDGPPLELPGGTRPLTAVAFAPDGRRVAGGDDGGVVRVWDLDAGGRPAVCPGAGAAVSCLGWSPGGALAAGRSDGVVDVWDADLGAPNRLPVSRTPVLAVAFSPAGRLLATGARDFVVSLWDVPTRERRAKLLGHSRHPAALAFTPDGRTLASAGGPTRGRPGEVKLWDVATGHSRLTLPGLGGPLAFAADDRALTAVGPGGRVEAVAARFPD